MHGLYIFKDLFIQREIGHLLHYADFVVALDSSGCVIKQGPPDEVTKKNGQVSGIDALGEEGSSENAKDNNKPADVEALADPASFSGPVDEETQRLGDGSVYKYYFRTFGWPKTVAFFALQTSLVFCLKFPGMSRVMYLITIGFHWHNANCDVPQKSYSPGGASLTAGILAYTTVNIWLFSRH